MSQKIALLFSGQGAQAVGMGRDLAEKYPVAADLFQEADDILGYSLSDIAFNGPVEELTRTDVCQPALYVHGMACLAILREHHPDLQFVAAAGLSLGEFTAHAAAGTFSFETGLRLVAQRSAFMQEACESSIGGMAAMIGGDESAVFSLAAQTDVDVANLNCPGQIVLSGEASKIALAVSLAKEMGIRKAMTLNVAGAFHSRLMEPAYQRLSTVLAETPMVDPQIPVICNIDALPVSGQENIRRTLAEQVTGSVRWSDSLVYLVDHLKVDLMLELGPGGVLAGHLKRTRQEAAIQSIADIATLEKTLAALDKTLAAFA